MNLEEIVSKEIEKASSSFTSQQWFSLKNSMLKIYLMGVDSAKKKFFEAIGEVQNRAEQKINSHEGQIDAISEENNPQ